MEMLIYWIWFAQLKKLSKAQKQWLLEYFRDPEEIYHSEQKRYKGLSGMTQEILQALEQKDLSEAQNILAQCEEKGIGILTFLDDAYPVKLRNTADAPMVLYYRGKLPNWENVPVIGIVGTRKATPYGMNTALRFGRQIAACGALVVSGGASGIDTMAMRGAMEAGRPVVGVLGCGVDVVYPKPNRQMFENVLQNGCLLSEYPPGTKAYSWNFPERNRIISGVANGLLVVEAPEKSGALNTARHAMEQGRDVFAVPGNVDVAACAGSNALLQEQAAPALSGWDVVKQYEALYPGKVRRQHTAEPVPKVAQKPVIPEILKDSSTDNNKKSIDKEEKSTYSVLNVERPPLSNAEAAVFAQINREECSLDDLIDRVQLPAGAVKSALTRLALKKLVVVHPGGRVSLKET